MHRPWVLAPAVLLGLAITQLGSPAAPRPERVAFALEPALDQLAQEVARWECELPRRTRPVRPADATALAFTEPATPSSAEAGPKLIPGFGTGEGQNPRARLTGSLPDSGAADTYTFALQAGEVFSATTRGAGGLLELRDPAGTLVQGAAVDRSGIYPDASPLLGGGNATVDHVAAVTGVHTLTVRRAPAHPAPPDPRSAEPAPDAPDRGMPAFDGGRAPTTSPAPTPAIAPAEPGPRLLPDSAVPDSPPVTAGHRDERSVAGAPPADPGYVVDIGVFQPAQQAAQRVVLEFGGATVDVRRFGVGAADPEARLGPMADYLAGWGLEPADLPVLITAVTDTVRANLAAAVGGAPVDVTAVDDPSGSPFGQPGVSRVVIGGSTQEAGIGTVGISESVDPGNFVREETALVLLDRLSSATTPDAAADPASIARYIPGQTDRSTRIEFVGRAVGNIASHEAGHFLGSWHTDPRSGKHDLMAPGDIVGAFGVGPDLLGRTADDISTRFGQDAFDPALGLSGTEDTRSRTAVGLHGVAPTPD